MCTCISFNSNDFYFGRNLDLEYNFGEKVIITPRNYLFKLRNGNNFYNKYSFIGMATCYDNYPLYADSCNEKGLCMAGLYFPGNAKYNKQKNDYKNIATFEFIPWILAQCASVCEAREKLEKMNLVGTQFSEQLPAAQLHWMIADEKECIVVECMADGLHIYDNPAGVLTNNPPFPQQMFLLNQYMHLSPKQPVNAFSKQLPLEQYSRGMGALGLPGDLSSASRFARVAFTRLHAMSGESEKESISQFFHILGSVDQQRGCCEVADGKYEITLYTSCCNATKGIYYYTTYENHQITAVDMHRENLDGETLVHYPIVTGEHILWQN